MRKKNSRKLPKIIIKSIPHSKQRYDTAGDYLERQDGTLEYRVSVFGDEYKQLAVALHELVESFLCKKWGISWDEVDRFDIAYEKARSEGKKVAPCGCKIQDEVGDDIHAPYHKAHKIATEIERKFVEALGYDWDEYNKEIWEL